MNEDPAAAAARTWTTVRGTHLAKNLNRRAARQRALCCHYRRAAAAAAAAAAPLLQRRPAATTRRSYGRNRCRRRRRSGRGRGLPPGDDGLQRHGEALVQPCKRPRAAQLAARAAQHDGVGAGGDLDLDVGREGGAKQAYGGQRELEAVGLQEADLKGRRRGRGGGTRGRVRARRRTGGAHGRGQSACTRIRCGRPQCVTSAC
jgi:hypothetical protein